MEIERGYVVKESREGVIREYNMLTLQDGKIKSSKETENTGATKMYYIQLILE